ncbi:MAG: 7TM diverse intracellular signaling domain-containing protein [Pseudohongiellaceae bacterium]|nr:7TM diverse intracellular signaling domain-containing protein [Pseudohongiellaceae bacterium]
MHRDSNNIKDPSLVIVFIVLLAVLLALFTYLKQPATDASESLISLSTAQALPLDIELSSLPSHEAEWVDVTFPFHWRNEFTDTRAVWYRLNLSASQVETLLSNKPASDSLLGMYIWRLNQTADVWVNGVKIGSGGRTQAPMARYWNSPLYFSLPISSLQQNNQIHIKHFSESSWGSMEPIVIGAQSELKPLYDKRAFVQHDIALSLFSFVLTTGFLCLMVWFYRRQNSEYLWFAIASAGLSFYCLNQFIRYLPVSADTWRWFSNVSIDLWAIATFIFGLRSLEIHKPRAEKLALLFLLSGIPIYFYASFFEHYDINIFYHIGALAFGGYGFLCTILCYKETRKPLAAFYACVVIIILAAGAHDTLMQAIVNNGWREGSSLGFQNHFNSIHFFAPLTFLAIGASLIKRFIDSMNEADRLNTSLEKRVEDARQELDENYKAIEKVLIKQSANEERERIYRDLHDDVGSKLLSLFYRLENESDSVLAKSALEDLRDIVSQKSLQSCHLNDAAAQWHDEIHERARDAGISLSWAFDDGGHSVTLSEKQHSHLRRMLREVLSNALLHSKQIKEMSISMTVSESTLSIDVANDGAPKPVSDWVVGRGISNLRVRSRDLDGEFDIHDLDDSWIKVSWRIPIQLSSKEQEPSI